MQFEMHAKRQTAKNERERNKNWIVKFLKASRQKQLGACCVQTSHKLARDSKPAKDTKMPSYRYSWRYSYRWRFAFSYSEQKHIESKATGSRKYFAIVMHPFAPPAPIHMHSLSCTWALSKMQLLLFLLCPARMCTIHEIFKVNSNALHIVLYLHIWELSPYMLYFHEPKTLPQTERERERERESLQASSANCHLCNLCGPSTKHDRPVQ